MSKHHRQHRISRLLADHVVTSQEMLVSLLADDGLDRIARDPLLYRQLARD